MKSLSTLSRMLSVPLQSPFERLDVQELETNLFRQRLYRRSSIYPIQQSLDYPEVSHENLVQEERQQERNPLMKRDLGIGML